MNARCRSDLVRTDRDHLIHSLHHPSDHEDPVILVRGQGAVVEDIDGHSYLDGLSGLWNVNVGHGRTELSDTAAAQMKKLAYASPYAGFSNIPAIELANRLIQVVDRRMDAVFFTSGGAEANESALKTARFYWKALGKSNKTKIVSRHHSYHGVTLQTMSATSLVGYSRMFEPRVPGFVHIGTSYPYRFPASEHGETAGFVAARQLEEAILREGADTIAAFIGEPIQGAGGVFYPADDYWPRIRQICSRHDVLLIADEIITGFCRTGRWFALDHWDVTPDIITFAKGVTSGYLPLGGMLVSRAIKLAMDSVPHSDRWMHAYTYSGHPVCCALALKNIEILERERLSENADQMGDRLYLGLKNVLGHHPNVGDIRGGKGLLSGLELVEDRDSKRNFATDKAVGLKIQAEMKRLGVITRGRSSAGDHPAHGDLVLFAPPLIVKPADIDRLVETSAQAIKAVLG